MTTLVLLFIATYFIELLYRRIILDKQWENEIKKFNLNKDYIMSLNLNNYKLGCGHLYKKN